MATSGQLLRQARLASGLSQAELASRAGVTQSVVSAYEGGAREPALSTLQRLVQASGHGLDLTLRRRDDQVRGLPSTRAGRRLRRHRRALVAAAERHGARNLRVFGSVARGDDRPDSDVDLLVDLPEGTGLFGLQALEGELRAILRTPVDLAPADSLKPRVRARAEAEAIAL
jgi:predicted nucleotidyltransferase/DNA-binding XRE family transcriptional regulator